MKRLLPKKKVKQPPKRLANQSTVEYEHALHEYHQTVQPTLSNDDGRNSHRIQYTDAEAAAAAVPTPRRRAEPMPPIQEYSSSTATSPLAPGSALSPAQPNQSQQPQDPPLNQPLNQQYQQYQQYQHQPYNSSTYPGIQNTLSNSTSHDYDDDDDNSSVHAAYYPMSETNTTTYIPADSTYEEFYGDAYVGAPLKYVYPNGYQSMRPRGGPWKLSIVICMLFTWLSVFIVGHCSKETELDDDTLFIDTKWCGSHLLYAMWVVSMLITGLSAAYCSVIGYIKVRDFAVANSRSQPPGMGAGKSDYYPSVGDVKHHHAHAQSLQQHHQHQYHQQRNSTAGTGPPTITTIYQSDGTPQFWGGHIYRPTQAAVAVTSR